MLVSAVAEVVTIGAVLPVLALAADPETLAKWPKATLFLNTIGNGASPVVAAAGMLIAAALFAMVARILITWFSGVLVYGMQYDIVMRIFGRIIRQPYETYVTGNSSVALSALEKVNLVTTGSVLPALLGIISAWIAIFIIVFLFALNPIGLLVAVGSIGVVYVGMTLTSRGAILRSARHLAETRTERVQIVQESLGGFRDIVLEHSQPQFEQRLARRESRLRQLLVIVNALAFSPRFVVEGAATILVAIAAAYLSFTKGGLVEALPILGALALGAQRLLPLCQQIFQGWASFELHADVLADVATMLHLPIADTEQRRVGAPVLPFEKEVVFDRVSYSYVENEMALDDVSLVIPRGSQVGLIGRSGSGKSTFVDLLMGLIKPIEGAIKVDERLLDRTTIADWQAQIAHVPQAIFLSDDSITANVAFGFDDEAIDVDRVRFACEQACILDFVEGLPDGFDTRVGERGIRLSGGQRQRLGIARALYRKATVLVLDEATSALDTETESEVMRRLRSAGVGLTVIMIAHRHSTLEACDIVYRLDGGHLKAAGRIEDIANWA
jgi:ABC-type bacteriocin/lantibiotic exporter with double-glycine peptidase domain